jgi:hypothetical protein
MDNNTTVESFSSQISLTTSDGRVYVFNNKDLPNHVLKSIDLFCDEIVDGFEHGYTYDANEKVDYPTHQRRAYNDTKNV